MIKCMNHTYQCLDVDMAWNSGDRALKSLFSAKPCLASVIDPWALVSRYTLEGHKVLSLGMKELRYTVSELSHILPYM